MHEFHVSYLGEKQQRLKLNRMKGQSDLAKEWSFISRSKQNIKVKCVCQLLTVLMKSSYILMKSQSFSSIFTAQNKEKLDKEWEKPALM